MHAQPAGQDRDQEVPSIAPGCDPSGLPLTPSQGYLLSRVDGSTPWKVLRQIGGLPPVEVDRCLARWLDEGILVIGGSPERGAGGGATLDRVAAGAGPAAVEPDPEQPDGSGHAAGAAPEPPAVDDSLELPVEIQREILAFEKKLAGPYHEILGVARDADTKTIKRAYFALSKRFHPDRYFRKRTGPFGARLEALFRRVIEAYELLSDPTARAELERSTASPVPAAVAGPAGAGAPRGPRVPSFWRMRHQRVIAERKLKAKGFFESGMAARLEGRFREAAASIRLAIAYDPANAAYRGPFAEVQRMAHEERAKQLFKEADASYDLRHYEEALRLYEEAITLSPGNAEANHRAAMLAWKVAGDLKRAKEFATHACDVEPDVGHYHRVLGQIYLEAGLHQNARRELERALRLDPSDAEARAELKRARKG
jgi:curved DNA-binding protein CbpA